MDDIKAIKNKLNKIRTGLMIVHERRTQIENQVNALITSFEEAKTEAKTCQEAMVFLKTFIVDRKQSGINTLAKIGTSNLSYICGPSYSLHFNTFDEKRKEGSTSGFKMELEMESDMTHGKLLRTGLMNERGGGIVETASIALRLAELDIKNYKGLRMLDESYKYLSSDQKLLRAAKYLGIYFKESDVQGLFVTHRPDVFGKYANNIIYLHEVDGLRKSTNIDYIDLDFVDWRDTDAS